MFVSKGKLYLNEMIKVSVMCFGRQQNGRLGVVPLCGHHKVQPSIRGLHFIYPTLR